jgi:hypothetical protein
MGSRSTVVLREERVERVRRRCNYRWSLRSCCFCRHGANWRRNTQAGKRPRIRTPPWLFERRPISSKRRTCQSVRDDPRFSLCRSQRSTDWRRELIRLQLLWKGPPLGRVDCSDRFRTGWRRAGRRFRGSRVCGRRSNVCGRARLSGVNCRWDHRRWHCRRDTRERTLRGELEPRWLASSSCSLLAVLSPYSLPLDLCAFGGRKQ